jgi:hypothetical protein
VSNPPLNTHIPQIQIQWPKLDLFTESVSTNGVAPRRPRPASPWSNPVKSNSNSNLNSCFVADLVKSIENKILNQKLQMIPRWNP